MSDATFRDLVLDATDAPGLADFWAALLGRRAQSRPEYPEVRLAPAEAERDHGLMWVQPVPEPRTVKTRVHLDVRMPAADPSGVAALGAHIVREPDDEIGWWVAVDPEGNEFCLFGPGSWGDPPSRPEPFELVVDAAEPLAIARWWSQRLGGLAVQDEQPWAHIEGAADFPYRYWVFNPVPERKSAKNRMHWDVNLLAPDPSAFVAAGARVLSELSEPDGEGELLWWVLADPEGNEFCAFPPG